METVINYIEEKGAVYLISQLLSIIATFFLLFSYQMKTHKRIVCMQAVAGLLFGTQYLMLGAYEGMVGNIIGFTRSIAYCFRGKSKFVDSFFCPIIFSILAGLGGLLTYTSPASLLPMAAMMISSFVMWSPKTQKLRALTVPTSLMWLIYNVICNSWSGVITEVFNLLSIAIGLFRFREKKSEK